MDLFAKMDAEGRSYCDDICHHWCRQQDRLERHTKACLAAVAEHVQCAKKSAWLSGPAVLCILC